MILETNEQTPEEFYVKFKERLEATTEFPSYFTYKFIIPTSLKTLAEVQRVFDGTEPQFKMNESKNGKYTSLTAVVYVIDADQVIHYYQEASQVEGIIML